MRSTVAFIGVILALLCAAHAQNKTFCYPSHFTASVISSQWTSENGVWNDDELLVRYDEAMDSDLKALRQDTFGPDQNYTALVFYEKGAIYTWEGASSDCVVRKITPIPYDEVACATATEKPEPATVAGVDAYLYVTEVGNYSLYALLTTSGIPVSTVVDETIGTMGYVIYSYYLNVNTAAVPSSKFTPPSNCQPGETSVYVTSRVKSPLLPIRV